jgi:hypothetical protein
MVPLRSFEDVAAEIDWDAEWEALAHEIDSAWKGERSAIEILAEMRR